MLFWNVKPSKNFKGSGMCANFGPANEEAENFANGCIYSRQFHTSFSTTSFQKYRLPILKRQCYIPGNSDIVANKGTKGGLLKQSYTCDVTISSLFNDFFKNMQHIWELGVCNFKNALINYNYKQYSIIIYSLFSDFFRNIHHIWELEVCNFKNTVINQDY